MEISQWHEIKFKSMALLTRRLLAAAAGADRLFSLLLVLWTCVGSSAPAPVRLGVVLDLTSNDGMKSLACIYMALDDFYLEHPTYATRVEMQVRDSRGDLVTAALAAEELVDKNAQVQAIISLQSQTSPQGQAEVFAGIAERDNIPILYLSATVPASTSSQSRFLVDTAPSISSQAAPIAAILETFPWHSAVLLHEDSPYGIGILSALVHAFQGSLSRALTDSVAVPSDATDSRLDAALVAVESMPTRVYIVHMPPALAARLFSRAVLAGMMSEGHVWIATAGVGNAVDSLANHGDMDNMQGVISLLPHVLGTEQVRSFSRRFKEKFRQDDDSSTPVWLLWLYDTAWAAATAAEASFRTAQRTTFLDALVVTEFDGLAGRFMLVDGQLQVSAYEIVNITGKGARTVGFWTPELGISTSLYPKRSGKALKQILLPGETAAVPIGWNESPSVRPLHVAVPIKTGFNQFVGISATESVSGYCIDVFKEVMTRLNYTVAYKSVPPSEGTGKYYDELVNLVHNKKADAVAGDMTITASRMKLVSFTMPFTDMGWSMIMAEKDYNSDNLWMFMKPMTPELWLTTVAFFFFTGFVVWAIEHKINPRFRGTPWNQFGVLFYFAFSTMVFSHKEKLKSNLSKLVVIMWVFVVLILTTSYTANLTSVWTVQQLKPAMNDWTNKDYVGFQEGSMIEGFLREMGFEEARFRRYESMEQYADALDKGSDNGGVTAIFDEVPYLKLFLSRYCHGYSMVGPTYKSGGFGFVFPMGSPLLVASVSLAIVELAEENKLARIESKWFNHPGACVDGKNNLGNVRLGLRRFGGLFLVNAVVSCLMLLIHLLARFVSGSGERPRGELGANSDPDPAGVFPWLRVWLGRFDALARRRGSRGADEPNHLEGLATGATVPQEVAMGDSRPMPVDASDSGRNAASGPVSEGTGSSNVRKESQGK